MTGEIGIECLELFVRLWMAAEMPDYAKGSTEAYERFWEVTSLGSIGDSIKTP